MRNGYYRAWLRRAVVGALQAVGFKGQAEAVRTVVLWALSVLVLYSTDWRRLPVIGAEDPGASSEVRLGLSALAGVLVVFVLTFLWQLVVQPAAMDEERRAESDQVARTGQTALDTQAEEAQRREARLDARIAELQADVTAMLDAEALLQRLSNLQRDGRSMYDREADPATWSQRLGEWNVQVEEIIRTHFSISDMHRYQSRRIIVPYETRWSWPGESNEWMKSLYSSRLENIDDIIRFGSPVNLARMRLANGSAMRAALGQQG